MGLKMAGSRRDTTIDTSSDSTITSKRHSDMKKRIAFLGHSSRSSVTMPYSPVYSDNDDLSSNLLAEEPLKIRHEKPSQTHHRKPAQAYHAESVEVNDVEPPRSDYEPADRVRYEEPASIRQYEPIRNYDQEPVPKRYEEPARVQPQDTIPGASRDRRNQTPRSSEYRTPQFRLVIAIDFGTTFTGVAFATAQTDVAQLDDIQVIENWGSRMGVHHKIPSVISYSIAPNGEEQWGTDLSTDALTMTDFKLELELQDIRVDELNITLQLLDATHNLTFEDVKRAGGYPSYTWKTPAEITTDYLLRIFEHVYKAADLGNLVRANHPVDIVVSTPVGWSYQATNSTLRAIMTAGFNRTNFPLLKDMIVVSEPEAASHFTARHLKEKSLEFLKIGECFIMCDAGGGTVDLVAYQVIQLEPQLEIQPISKSTTDKCGSTHINSNFKRWLCETIGRSYYQQLEPAGSEQRLDSHTVEGGRMRKLMQKFNGFKETFSNNTGVIVLDLPAPLNTLSIPGKVDEGGLEITPDEMRDIFDPCVDKVIELIDEQRQQVERKRFRVRNVFLVGGFGESPYLREELDRSLSMRKITVRQPEAKKSWTAVVQGAVIYGIEKVRHQNKTMMFTSPYSYGIVIREAAALERFDHRDVTIDEMTQDTVPGTQFAWLIRKGDLILSDHEEAIEKEFVFTFRHQDSRKFDLPVYKYPDSTDDVPDQWETGQNEVEEMSIVKCDLSSIYLSQFKWRQASLRTERYYYAHLVCRMVNSVSYLEVEVLVNQTRIGYLKISTKDARYI